jgi:hypothetical protein
MGPSGGPDLLAKINFTSYPGNLTPMFRAVEYLYAVSGSPGLTPVVHFVKQMFI